MFFANDKRTHSFSTEILTALKENSGAGGVGIRDGLTTAPVKKLFSNVSCELR